MMTLEQKIQKTKEAHARYRKKNKLVCKQRSLAWYHRTKGIPDYKRKELITEVKYGKFRVSFE